MEYKKLMTILGIESRVLCHPPDMSSVRCLLCADAQGIKVSELKPPRTVFQSVSTAKYQHVNRQQTIRIVFKYNRTVRQMQCSDAYLCSHNMCFMGHTRCIALPAQRLQLSEHNKLSALEGGGEINTLPALYIVAGCYIISPSVMY
jgi:hypothetical protein